MASISQTDGRDDHDEMDRLESITNLKAATNIAVTPNPEENGRGLKRKSSPSPSVLDDELPDAPPSVDPWLSAVLLRIDKNVIGNNKSISDLEDEVAILKDQADNDRLTISTMEDKMESLTIQNTILSSRLISLERRLDRIENDQTDQKNRSMRDNFIIRTKGDEYKQNKDEDTAEKVKEFINKELRVPTAEAQAIHIDRAHRMGKPSREQNSMMIAKIPHEEDKRKIYSNMKILKNNKSYSISPQCAPQTEERRILAWPAYKAARENNKPVRFDHTGRLFISGVPQTSYDPIPLPPSSDLLNGKEARPPLCGHSSLHTVNDHQFIAYAASINSLQEVSDFRDFLHFTGVLKEADFAPYAFVLQEFREGKLQKLDNFHSDGDHFTGLQILKSLHDKKEKNMCVFMVHITPGPLPQGLITKVKNAAITKVTEEAVLSLKKHMNLPDKTAKKD